MLPEDVHTPDDVVALGRALLGEDPARAAGVLHVVSAWRDAAGRDRVLDVGPGAPRSAHDRFLLALARARAEAIVTTGRILRDEPALTHGPIGPPGLRAALARWRRDVLGLAAAPLLLVLTSGRDLDPAHPALHGPTHPLLLVPEAAAAALRVRLEATRVEVEAAAAPSLPVGLERLRERGAYRITVEAGPTTARDLYDEPVAVDELWLTRHLGAPPGPPVIPEPLPDEARRAAVLPFGSPVVDREESSGTWRFERRWRGRRRERTGNAPA